jgi:hypothetical protein
MGITGAWDLLEANVRDQPSAATVAELSPYLKVSIETLRVRIYMSLNVEYPILSCCLTPL